MTLSRVSVPPETVAAPPVPCGVENHVAGNVVPPNSSLTVGARITSPFAIWEIAAPAPGVPAEKSATVVSERTVKGGVGVAVGVAVGVDVGVGGTEIAVGVRVGVTVGATTVGVRVGVGVGVGV